MGDVDVNDDDPRQGGWDGLRPSTASRKPRARECCRLTLLAGEGVLSSRRPHGPQRWTPILWTGFRHS